MENKKFSRKNENEFSENMLESVYLFPDAAAHLLRDSIVHSARFTEPKDFTFGDWFENDSNPIRWIEEGEDLLSQSIIEIRKEGTDTSLNDTYSKGLDD